MARRNIQICDWCKKEEERSSWYGKDGWRRIELKFDQYNSSKFDLCPDCQRKLGIVTEDDTVKKITEPTTYEKLLEIVADIVAEAQG